jgi:hypothetical protein
MKVASLYDCFERHLCNLNVECETYEVFITTVVEKYLINMGGLGYSFGHNAEDTYAELCEHVTEMLQKKIYGHHSINHYRDFLRSKAAA